MPFKKPVPALRSNSTELKTPVPVTLSLIPTAYSVESTAVLIAQPMNIVDSTPLHLAARITAAGRTFVGEKPEAACTHNARTANAFIVRRSGEEVLGCGGIE
eukprot:CAMPEP_0119373094 /NCGR_PEP_ID=MMETSP1334-20130426/23628_1 /TAXON_ID=127549 /ORGANISM="Calcidiscus leptoporus, Strain RCC1130" /LENGTH=101 /DNA_ID=CAMNT_0007390757 /DNA_START=310 /DNA_END=612 /DNA_ORIENTATION=-